MFIKPHTYTNRIVETSEDDLSLSTSSPPLCPPISSSSGKKMSTHVAGNNRDTCNVHNAILTRLKNIIN